MALNIRIHICETNIDLWRQPTFKTKYWQSLMFLLYPFFWISLCRSLRNIAIVLRSKVCSPSNYRFCFFERTWSNAYWLSYCLLYEHFLLFHTSLPKKKQFLSLFVWLPFQLTWCLRVSFYCIFSINWKDRRNFSVDNPTEPPSFAKEQLLYAFVFTCAQLSVAYIKYSTDVLLQNQD